MSCFYGTIPDVVQYRVAAEDDVRNQFLERRDKLNKYLLPQMGLLRWSLG